MKELNIRVSENDLKILRENDYVLCVAKRVEDSYYNVIWQAEKNFTQNNRIIWDDKVSNYSLFASTSCHEGQTVFENILPIQISLGERAVLEKAGYFSGKEPGKEADEIEMRNLYEPVYPGLCQQCIDFNGETSIQPFFLSPVLCIPGEFRVKPVDKLLVWFEQDVRQGMIIRPEREKIDNAMLKSASGYKAEIDMEADESGNKKVTLLYQDYMWKVV